MLKGFAPFFTSISGSAESTAGATTCDTPPSIAADSMGCFCAVILIEP